MAVEKYKLKSGAIRWAATLYQGKAKLARKGGFERKRDAQAWLKTEEARRKAERSRPDQGLTYSTMCSQYLQDCAARMQANTVGEKMAHYRAFAGYLGRDIPARDVAPAMAGDFVSTIQDARGNISANRHLRNLKALWNWWIRRGEDIRNPWSAIAPYPEDKAIKYIPPAEDIDAVRLAANSWERGLLDLLYYTAARLSEIMNLTWEDVNLEQRTIVLWTRKRKGGAREPRKLALAPALHSTLLHLWNSRDPASPWVLTNPTTGGQLHRNQHCVKHLFKRLCAKASVREFTAHSIRHHVASRIMDSGKATSRQVQNFLGHQRLTTTETYLHSLEVDRSITDIFSVGTHGGTHGVKKGG